MKKYFVALILSFIFLTTCTTNVINAYASQLPETALIGTFDELIFQNFDSRFGSVHIRDDYNSDSVFTNGIFITNRAEIRRILNMLRDVELVQTEPPVHFATVLGWPDAVHLTFSERGAARTLVVTPTGDWHNHDRLNVRIFPNYNLISIESINIQTHYAGYSTYFYFGELDIEQLLNVSPISLLNHGVVVAFVIFCLVIALMLYYWFGTAAGGVHLRKESFARKYTISIWLTILILATLMVNDNHPQFFLWALRVLFLIVAAITLRHSKKHGLKRTMLWELIGITLALLWAFMLFSPITEPIVSLIGRLGSNILILSFIGIPVYMLFLVLFVGFKPEQRRVRTIIARVITVIVAILFFLLLFHPHVFHIT